MTYVRFYSTASFTLGTNGNVKMWNGTASNAMEYLTGSLTWTAWDGTSALTAVLDYTTNIYNIYLRGTGNTKISNSTDTTFENKFVFTGTQLIDSEGSIESLFDYATVDSNQHPTMDNFGCACLFANQSLLRTPPELGFITLADYCYENMFDGCSSLVTAPSLPATMLTIHCYEDMFFGCTSLVLPPDLPATTLASCCYRGMFNGCTSLILAPDLPATILDTQCYYSMFNGCTSLGVAPRLPAITLTSSCYRSMFNGCTSLISAPALPATTLENYCYSAMFKDCTLITTLVDLPATTLTNYCYSQMFYNTGIKLSTTQHDDYTLAYRIPTEGTGTTGTSSLNNMFYNSGVDTPSINTTYYIKDAQYMVTESEITAIADAIRLSSNSNASLTYPDNFIDEIEDMGTAFCYSKDSIPDDNFGDNGDLCIIS